MKNNNVSTNWLESAKILSQALPFMKRNAGQTIVIKYGGHAMEDASMSQLFARDIVLLRQVGSNPIVVHGGGPQIESMLQKLNIKNDFVHGLRVTDENTIEIVEMVLSGSINKKIVSEINKAGGSAVGLSGKDGHLILAKKIGGMGDDYKEGSKDPIDLGFVGEPKEIKSHILTFFTESDVTPVIAPIGYSLENETLNINADVAAGAIASATNARRLLMLTDVAGILDANGILIPQLTISETRKLIDRGLISGGMIPKAETCIAAVESGIGGAVIIDGRVPHAILLELFTEHGVGTLICPDN